MVVVRIKTRPRRRGRGALDPGAARPPARARRADADRVTQSAQLRNRLRNSCGAAFHEVPGKDGLGRDVGGEEGEAGDEGSAREAREVDLEEPDGERQTEEKDEKYGFAERQPPERARLGGEEPAAVDGRDEEEKRVAGEDGHQEDGEARGGGGGHPGRNQEGGSHRERLEEGRAGHEGEDGAEEIARAPDHRLIRRAERPVGDQEAGETDREIVDEGDIEGGERKGDAEEAHDEEEEETGEGRVEEDARENLGVPDDAVGERDSAGERRETVPGEDDGSQLSRGRRPFEHGDAEISPLDGEGIVRAVAHHGREPALFERFDDPPFLFREDTGEDGGLPDGACEGFGIKGGEGGAVDAVLRVADSGFPSHGSDGFEMVARDDTEPDAAALEEVDGGPDAGTELVAEYGDSYERKWCLGGVERCLLRGEGEAEQAFARAGFGRDQSLEPDAIGLRCEAREETFGSASDDDTRLAAGGREAYRAVAAPGREGQGGEKGAVEGSRQAFPQGGDGLRGITGSVEVGGDGVRRAIRFPVGGETEVFRGQVVFAQCPGLVQAEILDAPELLRGVHFLEEDIAPVEVEGSVGKEERHGEDQSLGNQHACEGTDVLDDDDMRGADQEAAPDHEENHREERVTEGPDHDPDRFLDGTFAHRVVSEAFGHAGEVAFPEEGVGAERASAGGHDASGQEAFVRMAGKRSRFTGDQSLVHLEGLGVEQGAVARNLIAGLQFEAVAPEDGFHQHRFFRPVVIDAGDARRRQQFEVLEREPGMDVLRQAERDVDEEHQPEEQSGLGVAENEEQSDHGGDDPVREEEHVAAEDGGEASDPAADGRFHRIGERGKDIPVSAVVYTVRDFSGKLPIRTGMAETVVSYERPTASMTKRHLRSHPPRYAATPTLLPVGMMVFFFVIFDGILMYLAPIVITGAGISESLMGLIIGSSSIAGLAFDFVLCRVIRETHYRRMFLCMLLLGALYPFFLFGGTTIAIYLVAMAVWGFYYDFYNMGTLDFVERTADPERHASNFGSLRAFEGTGYLVAPFLGSLLLLWFHPGWRMLLVLALPLGVSFLIYLFIVFRRVAEKDDYPGVKRKDTLAFFAEMRLWEKIGGVFFPILLLTLTINLVDSAIWTFGPLFSERLGAAGGFSGGAFMTAYALPPLFAGWVVSRATRRFGTKSVALGTVALGSLALFWVGLAAQPFLLLASVFVASLFLAVAWPSINAVYTEYIERRDAYRKETETLQDLFTNVGDTAGPIAGGYMAQYLGFAHAFLALGLVGGAMTATTLFMLRRAGTKDRGGLESGGVRNRAL